MVVGTAVEGEKLAVVVGSRLAVLEMAAGVAVGSTAHGFVGRVVRRMEEVHSVAELREVVSDVLDERS